MGLKFADYENEEIKQKIRKAVTKENDQYVFKCPECDKVIRGTEEMCLDNGLSHYIKKHLEATTTETTTETPGATQ